MNKKGATSTAVLFLVFAALALIGASLFIFLTEKSKVKENFDEFKVLGRVYDKYEAMNFYFNELSKDAFNKAYGTLDDKNNLEELKIKFIKNVENALDRNFADVQLIKIKNRVKNKEYKLKIENGVLFFTLDGFIISDADLEIETIVSYESNLKFEKILDKENI